MLAWLTIPLAAAAGAAEEKGGLPQLNPHDMAPQLIWLALTFVVLYFVLSRMTLPRIAAVLDERKNRIERDIAEAERLNNETQREIAEYEQKLADAHTKAGAIAREDRDAVNADIEAKRREAEAEDQARMAEAEQRISAMKSQAMAEVSTIAVETSQELVKSLIGSDVTADEVRSALTARGVGGQTA